MLQVHILEKALLVARILFLPQYNREWPGAPRKNGLALVPGKILCSEVVQVTPKLYRLLHDPRERHALRCWIRERTEHIRQFARGQTRLNRWGDKP